MFVSNYLLSLTYYTTIKLSITGTWSMTLWYTSDLYAWDTTRFMVTDNLYKNVI